MKLNLIIFLFAIVFLLITTAFEVNFIDYDSPIPYTKINSITFKDFRAYRKPGLTLDGMNEFAFICTNRDLKYTSDTSVEITTYFHPARSYVFNQYIREENLLQHELYHFRITEYFSRLIRSEIKTYRKPSSKAIDDIVQKYTAAEEAMQLQYDDETYHSYVLKEQKRWENSIDSLLASLKDFASTIVSFQR